ncbi:MAG: lipoprotein-releasing ABC transporter permease subunit [Desulfobacterales bacterium]|jgi:lipoprotein-releasing system permease protein
MAFEFFIGSRYLRAKRKQVFISLITLLSVAGVTVGVMALIVVIAVMSGFEADLKDRILGVESHLVVLRHGPFTEFRKVLERIDETPGVTAATPFVYSQVMLRTASGASGAVLRGIDPKSAGRVIRNIKPEVLADMGSSEGNAAPAIVLGKELARTLGVVRGDSLYVISPRGFLSPAGHVPAMKRFTVAGLFASGMYEYDGSLAYVPLVEAQRLLHMGDAVTGIEVRVDDIYRANKIGKAISDDLGFPFWTRDWMQMNRNLFSALKLEKTVMFIILVLIVLVAAFNIASTLIMMVMEKTRDIAILKAMGASNKSIHRIFVFNGMIIGAVGTMLGVGLGFLACFLLDRYKFIELPGDVYYITTLPVRLELLDVCLIAAAALVICFLATLYPARQAARMDPVEAIRYG